MSEDDGASSKSRSAKVIRSKKRSCVLRIGERQVHEYALKQDEGSSRVEADTNDRYNPMDVTAVGGPSKPEETNWHTEDCNQGGNESMLLSAKTVFDDVWLEVPVDVAHINRNADDTSDNDAEEDNAQLADVETVFFDICKWEGLEE